MDNKIFEIIFQAGSVNFLQTGSIKWKNSTGASVEFLEEPQLAIISINGKTISIPYRMENGRPWPGTVTDEAEIRKIISDVKMQQQQLMRGRDGEPSTEKTQSAIAALETVADKASIHSFKRNEKIQPHELLEKRKALCLTQADMAKRLETPYRTYQDWELGNRRIPGILSVALNSL